jgi:hypothetical protein
MSPGAGRAQPRRDQRPELKVGEDARTRDGVGRLEAFRALQAERARNERALLRERSQTATYRRLSGRGWARSAERAGHIASTAHVQAVYPFVAQGGLGRAGVLVGRDMYGSGPFALDPWHLYSLGLLHDANMLVLGLKDHGKSSLLKTWCFRQRVFGRRIEVFERKGEYRKVIEAMGGVTLTLKPGVHLNPLERVGSPEARESLLQAVTATMLGRDLTPVEELGLSVALEVADQAHSEREVIIPDLVEELRDPSRALTDELNISEHDARMELRECMYALRNLSRGPVRDMFDGPTDAGREMWDNPAVAIDLSQIGRYAKGREETRALAIAVICSTAFLDARRQERHERARRYGGELDKTVRANDEAWRVMALPGSAEYYTAGMKLARDTGVQYILGLHRLSDLSAAGDAGSRMQRLAEGLASECAIRVVYRVAESEADVTGHAFELSSTERKLITKLPAYQALWRLGERSFRVAHLLAAEEWELVQTDEAMGHRAARGVGAAGGTAPETIAVGAGERS